MTKWRPRIFAVLTLVLGIAFLFNLALLFAPDIFECGDEWPRCSSRAFQQSLLIVIAAPIVWVVSTWLLWRDRGKS